MKCPECDARLKCIDTRTCRNHMRRRYKCPGCNKRWSTSEHFIEHKEITPVPVPIIEKKVVEKPKPVLKTESKSFRKVSYEEARWRLTHPGQKYPGDRG
jgi:transcriptional regulator NrdR family protein